MPPHLLVCAVEPHASSNARVLSNPRLAWGPTTLINGGGGIRTHESFRTPVFKFLQVFCVWLRVVASGCGGAGFRRKRSSQLCVWLRLFAESVGKTLAKDGPEGG